MSTPLKIRILLADDHTVVRRGLRMVLESAGIIRDYLERAADGDTVRDEPLTDRELEVALHRAPARSLPRGGVSWWMGSRAHSREPEPD